MLASPIAIWLQNPASVLLVAPDESGSPIPYVRRIPRAEYWKAVGYQGGYNKRLIAGFVAPVEGLRFDPTARRTLDIAYDWRGARYAVANPMLAIGFLFTAGGSEWLERDMRQLFFAPDEAEHAATVALRTLERWQLALKGKRSR